MTSSEREHAKQVREQFTKQALPFTRLKGHLDSIDLLIDMTSTGFEDSVLDVACGPGLVACEFAKVAKHVSGIDLTDKMIVEAGKRQTSAGLTNMDWRIGSASKLPYDSDRFSVVISRYTFHHFIAPDAVLLEMIRVCKPGGRVLIADPALPSANVDAFNAMERLRDPSHTRALSVEQLDEMYRLSGLNGIQLIDYEVEMELEQQLAASFPNPGDEQKLREIFQQDAEEQNLGLRSRRCDDKLIFTYPISAYVGTKPE